MSNDDHTTRPGVDDAAGTRPTSPARGAASAAAARAAYEGAPKGETHTEPAQDQTFIAGDVTGESVEDAADGRTGNDQNQPQNQPQPEDGTVQEPSTDLTPDALLAAERLADYQRLNAEYVNYKKRVDRERAEDRKRTTASMVESLLPVLDEIHLAREHGELGENTPFSKIAAKLEGILTKYGVQRFGEVGETFDPMVHEALMHTRAELPEGTTETTVVMVMQPGYRIDDRVVRPARVSVADPA
ncbi:MAG: nucleotide exchange factor GrpE [Propionibacteriaceae bacterium]|nr:nucleotide exchange factor GrpE [Propionibacteriaceae bacterium]